MTSFLRKALKLGDGKRYVGYYMETDGSPENQPLPGELSMDSAVLTGTDKTGDQRIRTKAA
jgi:hypothetical protein